MGRAGPGSPSRESGTPEDHAAVAVDGWKEIAGRIAEQRHDFYVLDEFTYPLKWGWIAVEDVVDVLVDRPVASMSSSPAAMRRNNSWTQRIW